MLSDELPTHSRKHICKPTRAIAQTKGLQKSFRLYNALWQSHFGQHKKIK